MDFREQVGIYCLYDNNFSLLYVGQAGFGNATLFDRLRTHTGNDLAERWTQFSWFGLKPVDFGGPDGPILNEIPLQEVQVAPILNSLERILIVGAEPPLNRQGPKFGEAQKYSQHRDLEFVYPTDREILRQLYDQMPEEEEDPQ